MFICVSKGTPCSSVGDKLKELESRMKSGAEGKREMRLKVERYKQELLNSVTVRKISRPCPNCTMPIQKISGWVRALNTSKNEFDCKRRSAFSFSCNKVTCSACSQFMCWMCGKGIRGYDHFTGGGCSLAAGQEEVNPHVFDLPQPNLVYQQLCFLCLRRLHCGLFLFLGFFGNASKIESVPGTPKKISSLSSVQTGKSEERNEQSHEMLVMQIELLLCLSHPDCWCRHGSLWIKGFGKVSTTFRCLKHEDAESRQFQHRKW